MTILPPLGSDNRWHYRRSLASRVTILTALAAGATVALVALGAYITVRMQLQATLDDSLLHRAETTSSDTICDRNVRLPIEYFGAANVWVACLDGSGAGLIRGQDAKEMQKLIGEPEIAVSQAKLDSSIHTVNDDGTRWRIAAVHRSDGTTMVIAQSLDSQEALLAKLGTVMLLFGLAGVIGAGLAGWAVARNGLRPVRRLTADVEEIARTEDLHPITVEGHDEIARLATAFNQMLTALAASRDRQRQLVADAGHELRTPLTSLRTNLDLLTQADSTGGLPPEARAELLDDVRAQIEELTTLIGDLVELARDEPLTHVVEAVDLPEVVAARPNAERGWEIAVIRHGRLVAAGTSVPPTHPRTTLGVLMATAETVRPGPGPVPCATAEETERLLNWLERPEVRLVECPQGWAYPVGGAARFAALLQQAESRPEGHY